MSESTMSLNFTDLLARFGMWFGIGTGDDPTKPGIWANASSQFVANDCLRGGLEQVVKPPVLPGEMASYEWSWLKPETTVTLNSGDSTVNMPDDFAGVEGDVYLADSSADAFEPVPVVNVQFVMAKQAEQPAFTGQPQIVGIEPIKAVGATGQRYRMVVFPVADQAYTLRFQYYFLENALNGTNPFPPGGAWLAETINVSCKAYGEAHYNDMVGGPMFQVFMQSLTAAIAADRKNKPQQGGYNGDRSDEVFNRRMAVHQPVTVTYAGNP